MRSADRPGYAVARQAWGTSPRPKVAGSGMWSLSAWNPLCAPPSRHPGDPACKSGLRPDSPLICCAGGRTTVTNADGRRDPGETGKPTRADERDSAVVGWNDLPGLIRVFARIMPQDRVLDTPCADGSLAFEIAPFCSYVVGV